MPLETRTFDESYELARSLYRGYIDGSDVSAGSDYDIMARILAAMFNGNQGQAEFLSRQIFADTAEGDFLAKHAEKVGGILPATKASVVLALTAPSGTDTIPIGTALTHASGTAYTTTTAGTILYPGFADKTVVDGSSLYRLFLSPDTTGISVGYQLSVNGSTRMVAGVDSTTGAIDLETPLPAAPLPGAVVSSVRGTKVEAEADEAGSAGNKPAGDELTITTPPGTVDAIATIMSSSGGADAEGDDEVKARIFAHDRNPPGAGNASHYREVSRGVTSIRVADAVIYPGFRGLGTVDVLPIGPSGARQPTPTQIAAVDDALAAEGGVPYIDDYLVLAPALTAYTEVSVTVAYETGFEPDFTFSGSIGWSLVTVGSSPTRLEIGSDPTASSDIEVGDRILYSSRFGATWQVYERIVSAIGATYIDISVPLPFTPVVNGDARADIYASGPLGLPVAEALADVYDSLGPGVGSTTTYTRYPLPSDELDPVLRVNSIRCSIKSIDGIRDVVVDTINDVSPADITPPAQTTVRQGQLTIILQ